MGTELKPVSNKFGKLIEFCSVPDSEGQKVLGLIDIEGMRLIGSVSVGNHKVRTNLTVKMVSCGVSIDASPYYEFEIV